MYQYYNESSGSECYKVRQCREADQLNLVTAYITYDENKHTFEFGSCHYFHPKQGHHITEQRYVLLPDNISELNSYMCGLMNRKGPLCSQCIDGFGPALTSTAS